jgi:hypothetical protein
MATAAMKRATRNIISGFAGAVLLCVSGAHTADDPAIGETDSYNFAGKVAALSEKMGQFASIKGLADWPDFVALSSEADKHIGDCIRYLSESGHSKGNRATAILLMHRLSLIDYLAFARELLLLYDDGLVSNYELMWAVDAPRYIVPNVLFDNYDAAAVQSLYTEVLSKPGLQDYQRSAIEWSRNGGDFDYKIRTYLRQPRHFFGLE